MLKHTLSFIALACLSFGIHAPSVASAQNNATPVAAPCPGGWSHGGLADESDPLSMAPSCGDGVAELQTLDVDVQGGTAVARFIYSVPDLCRGKRSMVTLQAYVPELGLTSVTELGRAFDGVATIHVPGLQKIGTYRLELQATAGACYVNREGDFATVVVNELDALR